MTGCRMMTKTDEVNVVISKPALAYNITECAEATGVHADLIRKEVKAGRLPSFKVGRRLLIAVDDAQAWVDDLRGLNRK